MNISDIRYFESGDLLTFFIDEDLLLQATTEHGRIDLMRDTVNRTLLPGYANLPGWFPCLQAVADSIGIATAVKS